MVGTPSVSYLVCATPRSGSSLLCQRLSSTALAGTPIEFFHHERMEAFGERWGAASLGDYLDLLAERYTGPGGVLGMKVHWGQYDRAIRDRDPRGLAPNMRFVRISREDRLRQAISWVRALQTLRWSSQSKHVREVPEVFDADAIEQKLTRVEREEASWDALFERYAIAPHALTYERLVEAPELVVRQVLEFLGVEAPPEFALPEQEHPKRLADEVSDEWVARYRAELTSRRRSRGSPGSP
jgi:trehalose 2-sulfotransferase